MRKLILFIALSFLLGNQFLFSQVPSYVPTSGLVGYWPFSGNANDASGYGNNGTVNGATLTSDMNGNINSAYNFIRSGNSYIDVAHSNILDNITDASFSFKFNIASYGIVGQSGHNQFINKSDQNNNHQFIIASNFVGLYFYYGGSSNFFQTNTLPPLNQWNILTITYHYDGTTQNSFCKFYLNGILINTFPTISDLQITNYNLRFGSFGTQSYDTVDGKIDDIGIWNRALTPQEVTALYTSCTTPAPTGALTQTFCATPTPTVASLAATGTGIQWYAAATGGTALATTTALVNGTTYYASQTVSGCESTTRLAVNVILNNPTVSASITTICSGTNITLTASSNLTIVQILAFNSTYLWSTGDTTATINASPTATTTYWCDVTVNGVTCRKSVTITVNTPVAPTGALNQTFCATPAPTVASLTATGTGIQWYAAATGGTALATTTALVNGTTYYASQIVSNCESTARLAVTVTLNDPQITASATTVCSGTSLTLSASTTATVAQNCNLPANLQTGLVGYWPFCGNANDVSGNANNGTVNGATITTDRFGNANSAYSFDGVDDYMNLTNALPDLTNFTLSGWFYHTKGSSYSGIFSDATQDGGNDLYFNMNSTSIGLKADKSGSLLNRSPLPEVGVNSNPLISNLILGNSWKFITITINQNETKVYLDGNYLQAINQGGSNVGYHAISPSIGRISDQGYAIQYFQGKLDDFAIHNRILSPSEIAQLYTATPTYLWSTGDTTATINPTPAATTTYWCDVTVNGVTCRKSVTVTVNTTATPTGTATQTFCATPAPTVASLTATGTGIQWYAAATGGTALATTTALVNGTTYYASQTVSTCESTRLPIKVSLNDPQITASATTVCSGTPVTLTASNSSQNVSSCNGFSNYNFLDFTSIASVGNYTNLIKKGNEFYLRSNNDVFKSSNLTGPYSSLNFNSQIGINEAGQLLGFDNLNRLHISTSHNGLYLYDGINWSSNGLIGFGTAGQYFTKLANGRIVISKGGFLRDIYYSDDNGVTWINATNIDVDWNNIVIASNGDLYASSGIGGVNNKGVIKSTDNGSSWFYINSNLGIISSTGIFKDCVNNLFIVGDNKIFKSSNDGATWNVIANIPPIFTSFPSYGQFVVTSSGDFYYHGENYLFLSNNQGVTWTQITNIPGNFGTIREVDGNIVVCSTQGLYAKTLSNNTTFLWSTGETTAAINPSPTTNTTYWCDVTVNGVTCRKSITINVNPNITPTFTQVAAICYGATAPILPTNSIENITGTWSPAFNNTATTLYTFTPTAGLCATTATMTVTVNPIITPTFTQEADICYGATAPTLPTNSIENITGTWSPAFNNTATTLYTFTPDTGLCASTATMSVTVKPLPAPPTGVSVQTFCANIFPTLQSIIVNPSNVNWYSSSTSTTALPSTTYLPPGVTTYYASQYDSTTGCESNIRLAVSVNVLFENSPSTIEDQTYCSSDEKTIGDIITGGLNIVWYTTPNGGTPVSNSIIISSSSTLYAAIFNPITGCESPIRTKVEITIINCLLVSNNLLTINDNDLNDNLNIQNIENFPVNQIEIYNRLGELVWKTDYYNNADISFQGKANVSGVYQINSYLPTGTYYYILKYYDPYHIKYNEMKSFLYINNNN